MPPAAERRPRPEAGLLAGGAWELIEEGESDTSVYRRGDVFAKCCGPAGVAELIAERDRVEWLSTTDVPGPSVVDWLESPTGACLLTTAVPGLAGTNLPEQSREDAMVQLGLMIRRLHDQPGCPFERPLDEVIATAEDVVRRGAVNPSFLTDEWRRLAPEELLARVKEQRAWVESVAEPAICHGDACLPNVFFDPDTLEVTGVIDLGRLGVADRYTDLALTTIQIQDEWGLDPTPFLTAYGVPEPDSRRLEFFRLLDPLTWG